jgi:hypothetical protein
MVEQGARTPDLLHAMKKLCGLGDDIVGCEMRRSGGTTGHAAPELLHPVHHRMMKRGSISPNRARAAGRTSCEPAAKGKVESLVKFVKSDCVAAEGFASLDAANRWAEAWCAQAMA